jgi:hypothetical protein
MARIRTIKPETHSSPTLARVSIFARWVFIGLLTLVDDEGRLRDLPRQITGGLFPLDEDVTVKQVVAAMDELERVDCIRRYCVGAEAFMYLPGWHTHQRISKRTPSRIPEPPADAQDSPGISAESLSTDDTLPAETQSEAEVEVEVEVEEICGNGLSRASDLHKARESFPQSLLVLRHGDRALEEALRLYPDSPDRQRAAMDAWWALAVVPS